MRDYKSKLIFVLLLTLVLLVIAPTSGCGSPAPGDTPDVPETPVPEKPVPEKPVTEPEAPAATAEPPSPTPAEKEPEPAAWQWPEFNIAAADESGVAKYLSWTSMLAADTGAPVSVIPQEGTVGRLRAVKDGAYTLTKVDKKKFRDALEAVPDSYGAFWGYPDLGPFSARVVWIHTLSNSGVFVRRDSPIESIQDITPGTRWAVRSDTPYHRTIPKAILDWVGVAHEDIIFVNAGSYAGAARAVVDGSADISWSVASSPELEAAVASEPGLRYLDLNPALDPEGAARFKAWDPMVTLLYSFGPIQKGVAPSLGHWGTKSWTFEMALDETDPELVYRLVKWLDKNHDRYSGAYPDNDLMTLDNLVEALEHSYLPAHDGLVRYLRELGRWTEDHEKRQQQNVALLDRYVEAYAAALAQAQAQDVETVPDNPEWMFLWETYKWERDIPKLQMFTGLEVTPEPVMVPTPVLALPVVEADAPDPAATAPAMPRKPGELFVELVSVTDPSRPDSDIEVVIKTLPGATVNIQPINPYTGTRSSRPVDKTLTADDQGVITWAWHVHRHVALGKGSFEFTAESGEQRLVKSFVWRVS